MAEVHEGDFEGLVEGEGSWFGCWFVPEGFLFRAVVGLLSGASSLKRGLRQITIG